jgi:hypothetical protein
MVRYSRFLAQDLLHLLLEDLASAVVGIHDVVPDGVVLHGKLALQVEILDFGLQLVRDGGLLLSDWSVSCL